MKKSELKSIIKECVKEVLFEEGVLSNLVAEVAFGITKAQSSLIESKTQQETSMMHEAREEQEEARRQKMLDTKRKMLNAMGNSKMSKVFEGTEPLKSAGSTAAPTAQGPLAGRDANDAGIDISGLFSIAGQKWNALK